MMDSMERRGGPAEGREQMVHDRATGALDFAAAARSLSAATRRMRLVVPGFRTPPRLVGVDRTVRRHPSGATVAVRVRGRPWPAVVADMIDGVVVANRLDAHRANRVRADLWAVVSSAAAERRVA
jgi:hypothetical protein